MFLVVVRSAPVQADHFPTVEPLDFGYPQNAHYENTPIQIYRKFYLQKLKIFR